jgi:hypothetical protein
MLRQFTHKITALLLLILYLSASTGLSIYIHKCSCEHHIFTTLFVEHKCHEEIKSSCCSAKEVNEVDFNDSDSSCGCKTDHLTIKVNELYSQSTPIQFNSNSDFIVIDWKSIQDKNPNADLLSIVLNKNLYIPEDSPPILPSGRILLNLIHQSKTLDILS